MYSLRCPPCPDEDGCVCDEYVCLAGELAFPQATAAGCGDVECDDCGLLRYHTVPCMDDDELGRLDGAGQVVQKMLL